MQLDPSFTSFLLDSTMATGPRALLVNFCRARATAGQRERPGVYQDMHDINITSMASTFRTPLSWSDHRVVIRDGEAFLEELGINATEISNTIIDRGQGSLSWKSYAKYMYICMCVYACVYGMERSKPVKWASAKKTKYERRSGVEWRGEGNRNQKQPHVCLPLTHYRSVRTDPQTT